MLRNMIVGAFEACAWFFFLAVIAYGTWFGWDAAAAGKLSAGGTLVEPWMGAVGGFVAGALAAIVVTGLIFTLLDIRAGTDRIQYLMELGRDRDDEDDD